MREQTEAFSLPKPKWSMTLGDFTIQQTTSYSAWKAFWLRFMGWKVTNHQHSRG